MKKPALLQPVLLVLSLLLISSLYGNFSSAYAQESFILLRPKPDMVITEVEGENYVFIERHSSSYLDDRPINRTYYGTLVGELAEEVDRRETLYQLCRKVFEDRCLPILEETVGLKYWDCYSGTDEDPPAIYIGLYKPTEEQMRAIVDMWDEMVWSEVVDWLGEAWGEEEVEKRRLVVKFYEAFSHLGMMQKVNKTLELLERNLPDELKHLNGLELSYGWAPAPAWVVVQVVYGNATDHVSRELAITVVKAVREFIGYDIPIALEFFKKIRLETDLLVRPPYEEPHLRANIVIAVVIAAPSLITITLLSKRKRIKMRLKRRSSKRKRREVS